VHLIPFEVCSLIGKKKHFFETGIGVTLIFATSDFSSALFTENEKSNFDQLYYIRAGYRGILEENITVRIAPMIQFYRPTPLNSTLKYICWASIAIGYNF
jgi:hypothetical protein